MNILIVGCGKVGAGLANAMSRAGHDVAVVDSHKESFELLEDAFTGFAVTGVPIDIDVLQKAGVEGCDCLAAVTDDDNVNIMVAQMAREFFKVAKVITRIYDTRRRDIFAQFGLHTISPTELTVDAMQRVINSDGEMQSIQGVFGTTTLSLESMTVPDSYIGVRVDKVEHDSTETVIGVQPEDGAMLLRESCGDYCLQKNDRLVFARII